MLHNTFYADASEEDKATFLAEFVAVHNKILRELVEETKLLMQDWKDSDAGKAWKEIVEMKKY